jgi:alpha-1,4-digalacturonate transport system permease protein
MSRQNLALQQTIEKGFEKGTGFVYDAFINLFDWIFNPLQRLFGVRRMAYFFVLPNLVIFGIFVLYPMLLNFGYAFTGGPELFLEDRPFVGTQNFSVLMDCENYLNPGSCREDFFWRAVYNTIQFVVFQVGLMVFLSLVTALALNSNIRFRGFFRSVFFYPVLLSPIVVALLWRWILQEDGLLNALLVAVGMQRQQFMVDAAWARTWVILISTWANMGFYTLILLAGLQSIPHDLYEAARLDGAGDWNLFRRVTLPLLTPTMLVVTVLSLIRAVQVFDIVYAFTGGGPGSATTYMVQYIYRYGFSSPAKQYGLASGASLLMAGVLIILTVMQLALRKEEK